MVIDRTTAPHYRWGEGCDGWRLEDADGLSVISERMPPGARETRHRHAAARQVFFVLDGILTLRMPDGAVVLGPEQAQTVPPGVPHQAVNEGDRDARFLVISAPATRGDRTDLP